MDNKKKNIVSLIVTHSNRLRCLLRNLLKKNFNDKIQRSKNLVILRLAITKNNDTYNITLEMVYEGIVNYNEKKKYYIPNEFQIGYINYIQNNHIQNNQISGTHKKTKKNKQLFFKPINININITENDFKKIFELTMNNEIIESDNNYIFYLVRHGEAEHKIIKGYKKTISSLIGKKDTSLTKSGEEDAKKVGIEFNKYLNEKKESIDYYFVSDLHRTHQTLLDLIIGMNKKNQENINIKNQEDINISAYVLNCTHEIPSYKPNDVKNQCDSTSLLPDATENQNCCYKEKNKNEPSKQNKKSCTNDSSTCKILKDKNVTLNIFWTDYNGREICKDTNMIIEAIKNFLKPE